MNSSLYLCPKTIISRAITDAGAVAAGFAVATEMPCGVADAYRKWVAENRHGEMAYLAAHDAVRFDPRELLAGAHTVISIAFPYRPAGGYHHPHIADYALGQDYHMVLRARLAPVVELIAEQFGGTSRVCVDTAPIPERWWAVQAGVGFVGRNHQLIVPGVGAGVFLAEIITTLQLEPDEPCRLSCNGCGRCIKACPGGALEADGNFDARRCISYLTIEYRGDLPDEANLGPRIYGCDVCRRVCPMEAPEPPEAPEEFAPDPRLLALDRRALASLTSGDWRRLTAKSAMRRVALKQLRRNINHRS
jgi:epoxyqueuosine reductase